VQIERGIGQDLGPLRIDAVEKVVGLLIFPSNGSAHEETTDSRRAVRRAEVRNWHLADISFLR
jgi:hypothetical protein